MEGRVIVAIIGSAGSGKSTLGQAILRSSRMGRRLAFAEPIKRALAALFGIPRISLDQEHFKRQVEPVSGKTYRQLLQTLGTEWGRDIVDKNLWVNLGIADIEADARHRVFVVDDARFLNEVKALRSSGIKCFVVRVVRTNAAPPGEHISEREQSDIFADLTYYNEPCAKNKAVTQAKNWLASLGKEILKEIQ